MMLCARQGMYLPPSRRTVLTLGVAVGLFALTQTVSSATSFAQDASTNRINRIINQFEKKTPPGVKTRGLKTRGLKMNVNSECQGSIGRASRAKAPSTADLSQVSNCIQDSARMDFSITFEFNSARLSVASRRTVNEMGRALIDKRLVSADFVLVGHTDRKGSRSYNLRLSKRRADAVRDYLIKNFGVREARLLTIGYGFENLANSDEPYSVENRRVELVRIN